MAVDLQTVRDLKAAYEDEYSEIHEDFKSLREVYSGRFWDFAKRGSQSRSITSIFRDIGKANRNTLPPIRITRPIIWQICVKYQTFLSPVPMVSYYVDPPETDERRQEMTAKERYTLGVWRAGLMAKRFREIAWFQPLMGDAFIGCYPDPKRKIPVPVLRSPETAYPLRGFGGDLSSGHIFHWKERNSVLSKTFPGYVATQEQPKRGWLPGRKSDDGAADPLIDVYEYSDDQEFGRWCGTSQVAGIEHQFGFDIFQHAKFIEVPGETFGQSAVKQIVNMNEADNMLYSLLFQAVLENVFPTIVLTDPTKAPEEMLKGPGSVITLNPGGKFETVAPSVQALPTQLAYLAQNKQAMLEASGMPAVNFGTSPASSIVTGAAINELQGAGTGSTVEMVQSTLGLTMSRWNEMAMHQQRTMWPDDTITLNYMTPVTSMDLRPVPGVITMKGSDLKGGTANEIVFSPAMDQHDKLVMWLQAKGAGLVSDEFIRRQIGIPDSAAMEEAILGEELSRAVLAGIVQQLSAPTPEAAAGAEATGVAYIEGRAHVPGVTPPGVRPQLPAAPNGVGPPQPPAPGPPGIPGGPVVPPSAGGGAAFEPGAQGLVQAKPLQLPAGAPQPPGSKNLPDLAPTTTPSTPQAVSLNQVVRALAAGKYQGRVWVVGELAAKGTVSGPIDVAVTVPADRQTVTQTAPQFDFTFHVVKGEPQEQAIEVTGG